MYIPDQVNSIRERVNLSPTNLVPRETQFQRERQDFRYPPQIPERNSIPNINHEINQNQMIENLTGALSKILEEHRKDPREHQREMASTVLSAMEELEELKAKIIALENEQVGETRLNDLMCTAKEISERL